MRQRRRRYTPVWGWPRTRTRVYGRDRERNYKTVFHLSIRRRAVGSTASWLRCYSPRMLTCWLLLTILSFSNAFLVSSVTGADAWQKPGCHKVGHTRKISIPDCVEFEMTTNACRGYCESWAVPSSPASGAAAAQPVTSVGECCNIMETEPVEARVLCVDGVRTLTFKSAVSCSCYHCKKD